jgi:pimeloyl-ACP methyl ester carboxylesterase
MRTEHTTVDGIPMRWEEAGEGPPVVFVHGIPTSPALWRRVVPLVAGARCLAWEMVGYGRSIAAGAGRDISVARQADHIQAWLDAIGVDQAVLVGHDLGGGVVQIAAMHRPGRCAGIVLVNSICYDSWPIPSVKAMRVGGAVVERLPAALFRPVFAGFLRMGHDDAAVARESIDMHWASYAEAGGPVGFVRQIQALRTEDTLAVADGLPGLEAPARVVWGAADRFQKVRYGERLATNLGAPLTRLEGARHFVPEDHPQAVAEAVNAVLAE